MRIATNQHLIGCNCLQPMIMKGDVESWEKMCEKDGDRKWILGDMRRQMRYGRFHLVKLLIFCSAFLVAATLFRSTIDKSFRNQLPFFSNPKQPLVVVITPTYKRSTRLADLTRMANTLSLVKDVHWIVVEDSETKYDYVERLLNRTGLPYSYLPVRTIAGYPKRGWYQRTMAINYLRKNREEILGAHKEGVLYFGDDDNSYDIRLFNDYIRNVKKVGLWAVGMVGGSPVESPDVVNGTVIGFRVRWNPARKFAVDMAGFAINLRVVFNNSAVFGTSCSRGGGAPETCLLEDMGLSRSDIEPFGYNQENNRDILVWHTKTISGHSELQSPEWILNGHIFEYRLKNTTQAPPTTISNQSKKDTKRSVRMAHSD